MIFVICIVFYVAVLLKQYRSISKNPRRVHLKVWNKAWFNSIKIIYLRREDKQRAINKTIFIQTVLTRKIGGDLLSLGDFGLCSYVVEQHLKLSLIKLIILSKFLSVFLRNEGENTRSVYLVLLWKRNESIMYFCLDQNRFLLAMFHWNQYQL